jgi:hypothetical protein
MRTLLALLVFSLTAVTSAQAQGIEGDWQGTLNAGPVPLRIVLHVVRGDQGVLAATLDSPDQGARGMPITNLRIANNALRFEVPIVVGTYEGKVNPTTMTISGTWTQAAGTLPLEFSRAPTERVRIAKPAPTDGEWTGSLQGTLRVVVHLATFEDGMTATMDSPDQGGFGLPASSVTLEGTRLRFEMKQIAGSFDGTFSADRSVINGTWIQLGNDLPLVLTRPKTP